MTIRTVDQASAELGPYFEFFRDAVSAATGHFWRKYRDDAHRLTARSRANIMCDLIGDELKRLIGGKAKVGIIDHFAVASFYFGSNWVVRVHKMDADCRVATNDTQICLQLNENDLDDISLPGVDEKASVVFLGYIDNPASPEAPEVMLSCPNGDVPAWSISLGIVAPPTPEELPQPQTATDGTRVVPKDRSKKAKK